MKRILIILGGGRSILVRYGGLYIKHSIFYLNRTRTTRFFKKILCPGRFFAFFELFYSLSASIGQKDTSLY